MRKIADLLPALKGEGGDQFSILKFLSILPPPEVFKCAYASAVWACSGCSWLAPVSGSFETVAFAQTFDAFEVLLFLRCVTPVVV